jgi:prolyl oligopeptidase PreP (S9A serine peptidase family)
MFFSVTQLIHDKFKFINNLFTWMHEESLTELEKPERAEAIKKDYQKQLERLKRKKMEKLNNNPFLKGEDIQVEQNISQDDVSSSCLICHK